MNHCLKDHRSYFTQDNLEEKKIFFIFNREQFYHSLLKREKYLISTNKDSWLLGGQQHVYTCGFSYHFSGSICCPFPTALNKVFLRAVSHK